MPSVSLILLALLVLHAVATLWVTADCARRGCAPAFVATMFVKSLVLPVMTVKAYVRNRHRDIGPDGRPMSTAAMSIAKTRSDFAQQQASAYGISADLGLPPGVRAYDLPSLEAARAAGFISEAMFFDAKARLEKMRAAAEAPSIAPFGPPATAEETGQGRHTAPRVAPVYVPPPVYSHD